MSTSRRSVLAGLGLAPLEMAAGATQATGPSADKPLSPQVDELVRRSAEGNAALMQGDARSYMARVPLSDDFLLMSPFGGRPSQGVPYTPERIEAIARFFKNGSFEQELIRSWISPDTVVLATIERTNAEVGGLPAQDWALRVTLVYRREGSEWRLVHRHADPLARGVTVAQAAAIARGDFAGRT